MKIAFDYQCFVDQRAGGISRYFVNLASQCEALGALPHIFSGWHRNIYLSQVASCLRSGFGPVPEIKNTGYGLRLINRSYWSLLSGVSLRSFDIYHSTYYRSFGRPKNVRLVNTVHDFIHEKFPDGLLNKDLYIARKNKALRESSLIIAVSESTRNDLMEYLPDVASRCVVVHHGVNSPQSPVWQRQIEEPYLLFIGSRKGYKNFSLIKRLFESCPEVSSLYKLICFGGGRLIESEIPLKGRIEHVSGDDNVLFRLLSGASALLYPSLYEGFGIPILEAYSVGCPVLCVRTSSIPEVAGDCGIYCDGREIDDIRKHIHNLSNSWNSSAVEKRHMRARGFSWRNCAQKTLSEYKKIISP